MRTTVRAYAATGASCSYEAFEYELGVAASDEVDIAVESCGICHSDLIMLKEAWGLTAFPFVPGHEMIENVAAIGENVSHLRGGDRVGLGWHAGDCRICDSCLSMHHNLCGQAKATITVRRGGFASPVGSPAVSRKLLDFAARHDVTPVTEHFPMEEVNDAMDHLGSGKARYHIVLDN